MRKLPTEFGVCKFCNFKRTDIPTTRTYDETYERMTHTHERKQKVMDGKWSDCMDKTLNI